MDDGFIAGFLGDFTLGGNASFAGGSANLTTDRSHWLVSASGFGSGYQTPISYGTNGVGPWGLHSGIDSNAQWIWSPDGCTNCTRYFSTSLNVTAVPEPSTIAMLSAGAFGLLLARRRRSEAARPLTIC